MQEKFKKMDENKSGPGRPSIRQGGMRAAAGTALQGDAFSRAHGSRSRGAEKIHGPVGLRPRPLQAAGSLREAMFFSAPVRVRLRFAFLLCSGFPVPARKGLAAGAENPSRS